jgi:hypothetical protein
MSAGGGHASETGNARRPLIHEPRHFGLVVSMKEDETPVPRGIGAWRRDSTTRSPRKGRLSRAWPLWSAVQATTPSGTGSPI